LEVVEGSVYGGGSKGGSRIGGKKCPSRKSPSTLEGRGGGGRSARSEWLDYDRGGKKGVIGHIDTVAQTLGKVRNAKENVRRGGGKENA